MKTLLMIILLMPIPIMEQDLKHGNWWCEDEENAFPIITKTKTLTLLGFDYAGDYGAGFFFEMTDGVMSKYGAGEILLNQGGKWNSKLIINVSYYTDAVSSSSFNIEAIDETTIFLITDDGTKYKYILDNDKY